MAGIPVSRRHGFASLASSIHRPFISAARNRGARRDNKRFQVELCTEEALVRVRVNNYSVAARASCSPVRARLGRIGQPGLEEQDPLSLLRGDRITGAEMV